MNKAKITALLLFFILTGSAMREGLAENAVHSDLLTCRKLIDEGKFPEARKGIDRYRRLHPDDPHGVFLLARLEEDLDRALALYREAEILSVGPRSVKPDSILAAEAVYAVADIQFARGEIDAARAGFERIVMTYPASGLFYDAVYRLGVINLVAGEPKKGLEKFKACLDADSTGVDRALAAAGKMECYAALEEWQEVLASAREALDESDEESAVTPRVLSVIARAWRELGNEENAAWYMERLLKNYPDSYQAHEIRERGRLVASDLGYSFDSNGGNGNNDPGEAAAAEPEASREVNGDETVKSPPVEQPERRKTAFTVQAAAFRDRMNARKLYEKLISAGLDARVELKDVAGTHFYKVLVGFYETRDDAEVAMKRVSRATGERATVVIVE